MADAPITGSHSSLYAPESTLWTPLYRDHVYGQWRNDNRESYVRLPPYTPLDHIGRKSDIPPSWEWMHKTTCHRPTIVKINPKTREPFAFVAKAQSWDCGGCKYCRVMEAMYHLRGNAPGFWRPWSGVLSSVFVVSSGGVVNAPVFTGYLDTASFESGSKQIRREGGGYGKWTTDSGLLVVISNVNPTPRKRLLRPRPVHEALTLLEYELLMETEITHHDWNNKWRPIPKGLLGVTETYQPVYVAYECMERAGLSRERGYRIPDDMDLDAAAAAIAAEVEKVDYVQWPTDQRTDNHA